MIRSLGRKSLPSDLKKGETMNLFEKLKEGIKNAMAKTHNAPEKQSIKALNDRLRRIKRSGEYKHGYEELVSTIGKYTPTTKSGLISVKGVTPETVKMLEGIVPTKREWSKQSGSLFEEQYDIREEQKRKLESALRQQALAQEVDDAIAEIFDTYYETTSSGQRVYNKHTDSSGRVMRSSPKSTQTIELENSLDEESLEWLERDLMDLGGDLSRNVKDYDFILALRDRIRNYYGG